MTQRITFTMLKRNAEKDKYQEIKRQVRRIRRYHSDTDTSTDIMALSPWEARLSNMHQLLFSEKYECRRFAQDVFEILGDESPCPLEDLCSWIDNRFPNTETYVTNHKQMCKIVSALAINAKFLLQTMLDDDKYLQEITNQSDHVDFFDKLVIMKGQAKDWKLRLHIFRSETLGAVQESLHSHRNHFVSHCLYGQIQQSIWEPCLESDPGAMCFKQYEYDPILTTNGKIFNLDNMDTKKHTVYMREHRIENTYAGQKYYMHPSVIHKVTMATGHTITLVLNSRNVIKKSCFCSEEPWYAPKYLRPQFTLQETRAVLEMALKLIK